MAAPGDKPSGNPRFGGQTRGGTVSVKCVMLESELDELEARAAANNTDISHEIRRALTVKSFLDDVRRRGGGVYVQDNDGSFTEITGS